MAITLAQCAEEIEHTLGRREGGYDPASVKRLANRAGEHLYSMHAWKFREGRVAHLDLRAKVSLTGATWTEATLTLTKTGGFASYSLVAGDEVEITGGTGANVGFYTVDSRTSDNAIVLETSIGSAADGQTDIAGTIDVSNIKLPDDFLEARDIQARESLTHTFDWVSPAELNRYRNSVIATSDLVFLGSITHHTDPDGGAQVPILEIWPEPEAADTAALRMLYRSKWATLSDDNSIASLPTWMETTYIEVLRAFARGYYEEDEGTLADRLAAVELASYTIAAKRQDGSVQPDYGWLRGGAVESLTGDDNETRFWGNLVNPPS